MFNVVGLKRKLKILMSNVFLSEKLTNYRNKRPSDIYSPSDGHKLFILSLTLTKFPTKK